MKRRKLLAAVAAFAAVAAGCSSSSKTANTTSGGGGKSTITVGLITDYTGLAASGNKTSVEGVKAGIEWAAKQGYDIKYVLGDSQTSPGQVQTAAQQLVQQDHVTAVLAVSAVFFGAAPYLTRAGIPVIGVAEDGPEWITSKNMYSVYGAENPKVVSTLDGQFFKMEGASVIGAVGYGISPSSAQAAEGAIVSAQYVGLKKGYLNAQFPFGSTNVAPVALAMKNAGVDGMTATVDPNTGFALITALRQDGDNLKVALLPTGYGGDLVSQGGPAAEQDAQDVYFSTAFQPVEMNTPATKEFQAALSAVGVTGDPTYAEYAGYASVAMLVQALKSAGPHPTSASLTKALDGITNYDANGLLGSHGFSPSDRASTAMGPGGCEYFAQFKGTKFVLVPGAEPLCGKNTGKTLG